MTGDIKLEIIAIKQEIKIFLKEVRCPECNKLLAIQKNQQVTIRCGRCKHDTTIDRI